MSLILWPVWLLFNLLCSNAPPPLCSVHPFMPILATSSGQRQFPWPTDSEGEGDSSSDTEGGGGGGGGGATLQQEVRQDNALTLWWAGPLSPPAEESQDQNAAAAEASSVPLAWPDRAHRRCYTFDIFSFLKLQYHFILVFCCWAQFSSCQFMAQIIRVLYFAHANSKSVKNHSSYTFLLMDG